MNKLFGLVVCGGESSRMGTDKCFLTYHKEPQVFHLYNILDQVCGNVFISCNKKQTPLFSSEYQLITDLEKYQNIGPIASLLSAFSIYPETDFLLMGCDYPFFAEENILHLINNRETGHQAVTFYNSASGFREPLLGIYSADSYSKLLENFTSKKYSLNYFLEEINAKKIIPASPDSIISIDTPADYKLAFQKINSK